ncbi:Myofilin [Carabus blaptoides fortunei]
MSPDKWIINNNSRTKIHYIRLGHLVTSQRSEALRGVETVFAEWRVESGGASSRIRVLRSELDQKRTRTMFKNHLDMIGRNEPVSKKAKFWQSYVRSLKGSDDIRASEPTHRTPRGIFRPLSDFPELHSTTWPYGKSIYDDPIHASERISVPGYRYNPIHRETYGYSPRAIYPHQYANLDRYRPVFHVSKLRPFDADKAWQDHLDRIAKTHREFPDAYPFSRYPLYLVYHSHPRIDRKPAAPYSPYRDMLDHLDRLAGLDKLSPLDPYDPYYRGLSPTPIKAGEFGPRPNEVAFNYAGLPIYTRGGLAGRILRDLLNPSSALPLSAITRDPWWWKYPEFRPFNAPYDCWGKSPFFLRDSYLSPVKRTYLWDKHPIRPFAHVY